MRSSGSVRAIAAIAGVGLFGFSTWCLGRLQGLQAQFNQSYNDAFLEAYSALEHVRVLRDDPMHHSDELTILLYSSLGAALVNVENQIAMQREATFLNAVRYPQSIWLVARKSSLTPMSFDDLMRGLKDEGISREELNAALAVQMKSGSSAVSSDQ